MKLAKWGNSLAVRIPAEVVAKLGIGPNEDVEISVTGENSFEVRRDRRRQEAIEAIRKLAVPLPPGYKFNRVPSRNRKRFESGPISGYEHSGLRPPRGGLSNGNRQAGSVPRRRGWRAGAE